MNFPLQRVLGSDPSYCVRRKPSLVFSFLCTEGTSHAQPPDQLPSLSVSPYQTQVLQRNTLLSQSTYSFFRYFYSSLRYLGSLSCSLLLMSRPTDSRWQQLVPDVLPALQVYSHVSILTKLVLYALAYEILRSWLHENCAAARLSIPSTFRFIFDRHLNLYSRIQVRPNGCVT